MRAAVHNLGCKVNAYEADRIRKALRKAGFVLVPFEEKADVYVVNTCTVTNIADRKSRQMLHRARKLNPQALIVAAGCYAEVTDAQTEPDTADLWLTNAEKADPAEPILRALAERGIEQDAPDDELSDKPVHENVRVFVKIQDGCRQFCSYCIIPYARGPLKSRPVESVAEEIEALAAEGIKEVVLTGIHLSSYGLDQGFRAGEALLDLLDRLDEIPGLARIRLGSLEPRLITEEFAERLARHSRLCPHFHLSLQSGCAKTLKAMNRHYTPEQYLEVLSILRSRFDTPAITTDVICGFPGESEEDFEETCRFVRQAGFYELHAFPYSRRKGTKAAAMPDQLTDRMKRERAGRMIAIGEELRQAYEASFIDRSVELLTEEIIETEEGRFFVGHTAQYIRAMVPAEGHEPNELVTGVFGSGGLIR